MGLTDSEGRPGRPTKMTGSRLCEIRGTARSRFYVSDRHLAHCVGVCPETFQKWLKEYIGFRELVNRWKSESLTPLVRKARELVMAGDGPQIRYELSKRHPDYRPAEDVGGSGDDPIDREDDMSGDPTFL